MKFLVSEEIQLWYKTSLNYSGYTAISPWVEDIWKSLFDRGNNALPPGFLALLLQRMVHHPTGKQKVTNKQNIENEIIAIISRGKAFIQLEGEFILGGNQVNTKKVLNVTEKIIEKLGGFRHPQINFSLYDLEQAFISQQSIINVSKPDSSQLEVVDSLSFWLVQKQGIQPEQNDYVTEILDVIYKKAIDHLIRSNNSLDETDLFEINHPELFTSPVTRSLYLKMTENSKGIKPYIIGDVSLREENEDVVQKFGEQQILPLGGYESLINKGEISSLLPSELAFIDENEKIDYFDYKYLENELLYYKREEGSVFRIRRSVTLSLELTHGMEHEKNLALLFSFLIIFMDKLLQVFGKDIIEINICLYGYMPSEISKALDFFRHFIKEANYENNVFIHTGKEFISEVFEKTNYQHWFIGKKELKDKKFISFVFPSLDDFSMKNALEKYRKLASVINDIIERVAEIAYR